jgi:hypothetical protein
MVNRLEDLKYEVNCAVLKAIDDILIPRFGKECMVTDGDLPSILPHVERLTEKRLRAYYDLLPESLAQTPPTAEELAEFEELRKPKFRSLLETLDGMNKEST